MSADKIEIGEYVDVSVSDNDGWFPSCRVKYIPQATGDSWIFELPKCGLLYVQTYQFIRQKTIITKANP